jgi:hypothetical protein
MELKRTQSMKRMAGIFLGVALGLALFLFTLDIQNAHAESVIHIDTPVNLKKANVVFNMSQVDFFGDVPTGIKYMQLLATRFKETGTQERIIGIFHGHAAYFVLNDKAYPLDETGNPYKKLIMTLIEQGIQEYRLKRAPSR